MQAAADALARAQEAADEAGRRLADLAAQRSAMERSLAEQQSRLARLDSELQSIAQRKANLIAQLGDVGDGAALAAAVEAAVAAATDAEGEANSAEAALRAARSAESEKRSAHDEARRKADRLSTEVRTLTNFLKNDAGGLWPSVVDALNVEPGYETALAAALGDDIEASSDEGAPVHWRTLQQLADIPPLPGDATPLSKHVQAPPALWRSLAHVGVVSRMSVPLSSRS